MTRSADDLGDDARFSGRPVPGTPGAVTCPGVRCLTIAVTGDVLLHPPLVDRARADSPGGRGMNFAPMLAAEKPYVQGETPALHSNRAGHHR